MAGAGHATIRLDCIGSIERQSRRQKDMIRWLVFERVWAANRISMRQRQDAAYLSQSAQKTVKARLAWRATCRNPDQFGSIGFVATGALERQC